MMHLNLTIDSLRHLDLSKDDQLSRLGVLIDGETVHVPAEIGIVLSQIGMTNVAGFLAALESFPTAFVTQCRLTKDQFSIAKANIIEDLKQNGADPDLFATKEVFQRGMGAIPPSIPSSTK